MLSYIHEIKCSPTNVSKSTFSLPSVEGRIHDIHVFLIHLLHSESQTLAKALVMDNLPLPQITDHVCHIRIVAEAQDIIVGDSGFLLGSQIFVQICQNVPFYRQYDPRNTCPGRCG